MTDTKPLCNAKDKFLSLARSFLPSKNPTDPPPPYSATSEKHSESQNAAPPPPKQPKPPSAREIAKQTCQLAVDALLCHRTNHPTFHVDWASQNPLDNVTRLRNFLHFCLAREYRVEPLPLIADEDREYFLRLAAFLAACPWRRRWRDMFAGTRELYRKCLRVYRWHWLRKPVDALDVLDIAGRRPQLDPYDAQCEREKVHEHVSILILEFAIDEAAGRQSGEEQGGMRRLDAVVAEGDFEGAMDRLDMELALLEKVVPYGDGVARTRAKEGLEKVRRVYFEGLDEAIVRREADGRLGRVRVKGWRLTEYSRELVQNGSRG